MLPVYLGCSNIDLGTPWYLFWNGGWFWPSLLECWDLAPAELDWDCRLSVACSLMDLSSAIFSISSLLKTLFSFLSYFLALTFNFIALLPVALTTFWFLVVGMVVWVVLLFGLKILSVFFRLWIFGIGIMALLFTLYKNNLVLKGAYSSWYTFSQLLDFFYNGWIRLLNLSKNSRVPSFIKSLTSQFFESRYAISLFLVMLYGQIVLT